MNLMDNESEEPPDGGKSIQLHSAIRLPRRSMHGIHAGSGELVFVLHSPGSKPCFGYYYSSGLYQDDERNH